jgi:hypothetical protein
MSIIRTSLVTAAVAGMTLAAVAATAGPASITDAQYFQAQRCAALMSSPALGREDTHAIDAFLRQQSGSRSEPVYELGQQAHDRAASEARHPGDYDRGRLVAERDGACRAAVPGVDVAGSAHANHGG